MSYYRQYEISKILENGMEILVEYGTHTTPATREDPEDVELLGYRVTLEGKRIHNDDLKELQQVVEDLIYNGDPKEVCVNIPF